MRCAKNMALAILIAGTSCTSPVTAPVLAETRMLESANITTAVTKAPGSVGFTVRDAANEPLLLSGLPDRAFAALSWIGQPLSLEGEILGGEERRFELEAVALPTPPAELRPLEDRRGLLTRSPYGLYLRQADEEALRIGGPFATFLERLADERMTCVLRGAMRDGTFVVTAVRLRIPLGD